MTARPLRFFEGQALNYSRVWRASIFTNFLNPVLYLAAMGIGLGSLVDRNPSAEFGGLGYLTWLAPGLLAAAGMQSGASEGSFPVMLGLKWIKTFPAIMNTPLSVSDLLLGLLSWIAVRLFMICGIFAAILVLFDAADPGNALLAVFPAVLTGLTFAAPMAAFAAWLEDDTGLTMVFRFGIVPLFLFSGTFFPIEQLPGFLEGLAYATPLFHGVELTRSIALGIESALPTWQHVTYLLTVLVIGALLARHYLTKKLRT